MYNTLQSNHITYLKQTNTSTMKNVFRNNNFNQRILQVHVETPLIPLINIKNDEKLDKYCVKMKLRRYPTSEKAHLYELKMSLFDSVKPEEFLLFVKNFNMTLEVLGTLVAGAKIQYIHTLVCGEELHHIDTLSAEVVNTTSEILISDILGLGTYFFLLLSCQN